MMFWTSSSWSVREHVRRLPPQQLLRKSERAHLQLGPRPRRHVAMHTHVRPYLIVATTGFHPENDGATANRSPTS